MKKYIKGCLFFVFSQLFFGCSTVNAASKDSSVDWTGFYLGTKTGGVFSQFDTTKSTIAGPLFTPIQANAVNNASRLKINTQGFLSGFEGGYNWRHNQFLIGLVADIQSLSTNGESHTNAISYPNVNGQFVINVYGNNNWLFTARPRLGIIEKNWLFYATGGLALSLVQSDLIFSDSASALESRRVSKIKPGYVAGIGIETNLTQSISLKAEYLYEFFNKMNAVAMNHNIPTGQIFSSLVSLKSHLITFGFYYHFNDHSFQPSPILSLFDLSHWQHEIGVRLFYSSGVDGTPQPLLNQSNIGNLLASRLIFSSLKAISEEVFTRIDHSSGIFVKGVLGAGSVIDGRLNDEDFPALDVYSNTLSDVWGNLSYATFDAGYSFINNLFGRIDAFVGYNYYAQNLGAYSCKQLAGDAVCIPSGELFNFLGISQDDKLNSLRIGLSFLFNLTDNITLTSEAAYIPVVSYRGTDIHNARQLIGPEFSNHGDGSMLEAILNYQFNRAWSMGLGGRYWMWNMHNGNVIFDFLGQSGIDTEPARFSSKRYGVFLQVKYRNKQATYSKDSPARVDWTGIYIGGNLGGAWGMSAWSDPFGSTIGSANRINVAGFGDRIRSTGPLGGVGLNIYWQTGRIVYGFSGSISASDIRGENTLFSGIGGINGLTKATYLGTIAGKIGITFNRTLFYVNAGGAVINTRYQLNGNTSGLTLGRESQTIHPWGWVGGIGIEQALSELWTSSVEYDYIHIPRNKVSFPSVAIINTQKISANQNMNVFKLSVNRKFDILT